MLQSTSQWSPQGLLIFPKAGIKFLLLHIKMDTTYWLGFSVLLRIKYRKKIYHYTKVSYFVTGTVTQAAHPPKILAVFSTLHFACRTKYKAVPFSLLKSTVFAKITFYFSRLKWKLLAKIRNRLFFSSEMNGSGNDMARDSFGKDLQYFFPSKTGILG